MKIKNHSINYLHFLCLNNLPVTKGMMHNSYLLFLLKYFNLKKIYLQTFNFKEYFENIFEFILEHIISTNFKLL